MSYRGDPSGLRTEGAEPTGLVPKPDEAQAGRGFLATRRARTFAVVEDAEVPHERYQPGAVPGGGNDGVH
ncbi:MAG: hypothetical protein H0V41_04740, partial [Pseudonocardiales bacterium]|nr:hypothetical protein [Pseudonocardiales bacterium]